MTPKEKAIELMDKYWELDVDDKAPVFTEKCKQCALIAVEQMLSEYQSMSDLESKIVINNEVKFVVHQLVYWMEVKQEIEKL
jgi:hypothetical protein